MPLGLKISPFSRKVVVPFSLWSNNRQNQPPVLINGTVRNSMPIEDGRFRNGVEFNRIYFLFAEWGRKLRP